MAILIKSQSALNEIAEQVRYNWRSMIDERQVAHDMWMRCLLAYLCQFDKNWVNYAKQAGRSHRYVSLSWDAVETILPQIYDVLFTNDDAQKIRPIRPGGDSNDDDTDAEIMRHLLRYQMRMGKMPPTAKLAVKSMLTLGNCPWTVDWYTKRAPNFGRYQEAMNEWLKESAAYHAEYKDVMRQYGSLQLRATMLGKEAPPPPGFEAPPPPPKAENMDIVYEGPRLQIGSIFNYVQEQHPNDPDGAIRLMRSFRTMPYLKRVAEPDETGYKLYERLNNITEAYSEDTAEDNEAESLMKSALGLSMPQGKSKIMLKEQHGTFEIKNGADAGIYDNWIVVLANDHQVIRCEPSPMASNKPMINNARLITMEGAVYGIGIIEKALDEADSANALHNQSIDAVNSVIQPEFEVVLDALVDGKMGPSGPGRKHYVNEPGSIRALEKNFTGVQVGFAAVNAAIQRHERITGAINTAPQGDETATRTARNTNVIATKLGGHVGACEDEFLTPVLDMFLELNGMYVEDDQIFSVTQNGKNVKIKATPQQIRRGWYVYATGSKYLAEKDQRIQNLLMAAQMSAQAEASGQPSPVRIEKVWLTLFREILGDSADDMVMGPDEYRQALAEFTARQQQLMMAQQMTSGQKGPANGPQSGNPSPQAGAN